MGIRGTGGRRGGGSPHRCHMGPFARSSPTCWCFVTHRRDRRKHRGPDRVRSGERLSERGCRDGPNRDIQCRRSCTHGWERSPRDSFLEGTRSLRSLTTRTLSSLLGLVAIVCGTPLGVLGVWGASRGGPCDWLLAVIGIACLVVGALFVRFAFHKR